MPSIVAYRKATDDYTTYSARLPEEAEELATLDGVTYVVLPDNVALPADQPQEIDFEDTIITVPLLRRLAQVSPLAAGARKQADADVAAGRRTRNQADNDVRLRLRQLCLRLTRPVAVATIRAAAERCKLRVGFAAPALPNGTVRWLPISPLVIATLGAAKQATAAQVAGLKLLSVDGLAYPLTLARVNGALDAMWARMQVIDDLADATIAALPTGPIALEAFDFAAIPWPQQA
jgi:hypothetical protein